MEAACLSQTLVTTFKTTRKLTQMISLSLQTVATLFSKYTHPLAVLQWTHWGLDLGDSGWRSLCNQRRNSTGTGKGPASVSSLYFFESKKNIYCYWSYIAETDESQYSKTHHNGCQLETKGGQWIQLICDWSTTSCRCQGIFVAN